jgi:hypothetical protein
VDVVDITADIVVAITEETVGDMQQRLSVAQSSVEQLQTHTHSRMHSHITHQRQYIQFRQYSITLHSRTMRLLPYMEFRSLAGIGNNSMTQAATVFAIFK